MKKTSFIAGMLTTVLLFSLIGGAYATVGKRSLDIEYSDIQISLNGQSVTPTDASGNYVEPFSSNGTTYLPVRAVSEALGLGVKWDGNTSTVVLTTEEDPYSLHLENCAFLMGYFKLLADGFDNMESDFSCWFTSEDDIDALFSMGSDSPTIFKNSLVQDLQTFETHYVVCRDLLSDDDIALAAEYRRLANRLISMFELLEKGKPASVTGMISPTYQNILDCSNSQRTATDNFWRTYRICFDYSG